MRSTKSLTLKLLWCSSALLGQGLLTGVLAAPACTPIPGATHALVSTLLNGQDEGDTFVVLGSSTPAGGAPTDQAATDPVLAAPGDQNSIWLPKGTLEHWGLDLGAPQLGCVSDEPGAVYERLPVGADLKVSYDSEATELRVTAPASAFRPHLIDLLSSAQDESQPISATSLRYGIGLAYFGSLSALGSVSLLHLNTTSAYGAGLSALYTPRGFSVAAPQLWYSLAFAGGYRLRLGTSDPSNVSVGSGFTGVSYFSPDPGSTLPRVSGSTDVPAHYVVSVLGYPVAVGELGPGAFVIDHIPVPEGRGLLTTTLYDPLRPGRVLSTQVQPYLYFQALLKPGKVRYELDVGYQNVFSSGRSLLGVADLNWGITSSVSSHIRIQGGLDAQTASVGVQQAEQTYGTSAQLTVQHIGAQLGVLSQVRLDLQSPTSPWQASVSAQYSAGSMFGSASGLALGAGLGWQQRPFAVGFGVGWAPALVSPWSWRANAAYQINRNLILDTAVTQRDGRYTVQVGLLTTFRAPDFLSGGSGQPAAGAQRQAGASLNVITRADDPLNSLQPSAQLDLPIWDAQLRVNAGRLGGDVSLATGVLYPVTVSAGLSDGYRAFTASASVAGALAYVDGTLLPLAPAGGNVGEVLLGYPGIRVYVNGNLVGQSDQQGKVLISGLLTDSLNEVSFAVDDLPPEITVDRDRAKVYVAAFDARKVDFRPFLHHGTLVTINYGGNPIPETAKVTYNGQLVAVGSSGQVYLYDAVVGQVLQIKTNSFECSVAFRAQEVLECQEGGGP